MNDSEAGPSTQIMEDFNVFLNHRGPDTKATFVAHLDQALRDVGFRPFLDRYSLEVGYHNEESIYQALHMAKVHVVVVSKRYAESQYCLDELVAIMESHKPVIPVFYDVEPKDLLDVETGKFAVAFKEHIQTQEKLKEWTDALGSLSKIVGICFDSTWRDGDEAKLKQDVVNAVASKFPRGSGFVDENHRVGLEESRKEVIRKLESGRVGVVGLYSMGGIGKTTLATAVYEHCAQDFGCCSFLRDVRSSDALTLQNQIVKDLRLGVKANNHEEYQGRFRKLNNLEVLIVIDDIDAKRQFEDIILDLGQIGKGSKIIVTSRNQRVLSNVLISTETEESVLYEIELLNSVESQQLFNFRAFPSKLPNHGFEDLAMKVVDACGGHPLALEIAGGFLRNKRNLETDRVFWDEMIASKATRDAKLQSILKISYNSLDSCQKTMFLDISCHLIGKPSTIALEIWASCESCGCGIRPGINSSFIDLIERCLVKLDDGQLQMHDVLRDMGRDIVEPAIVFGGLTKWDRIHFWDSKLAGDCLEYKKGSNKVRGFSRTSYIGTPTTYNAEAFSDMSELHLLVLDGCHVFGDFSKWSRELRLLQWRRSPLLELPLELNLKKIAVLDLSWSCNLTCLWKDNTMDPIRKACLNLRRLYLNDCIELTTLTQDFGKRLFKLKLLDLGGCIKLESLPDSIGEMKDLEELILRKCETLQSIPNTIGGLKKLEHLNLFDCRRLQSIPDTIGGLEKLEHLVLHNCCMLQSIPETIGGLEKLKHLDLFDCHRLQSIPDTIGGLEELEHLVLSHCSMLPSIPGTIGGLEKLEHLDVSYYSMLQNIPDTIGGLEKLEYLDLSYCHMLNNIPNTIGGLKNLKHLNLKHCSMLQSIPDTIGGLDELEHFYLLGCSMLQSIPDTIGGLEKLEDLILSDCSILQSIPDTIGGLEKLEHLYISYCSMLQSIPDTIGGLEKLEHLNLSECSRLQSIPDTVGGLKRLKFLQFRNCKELRILSDCIDKIISRSGASSPW